MSKSLKVLLVDDHPLILDSYRNALSSICDTRPEYDFTIKMAADCETANYYIEQAATGIHFDLVLLDIRIPPYEHENLFSGEDLGVKIRSLFPDVKIMVITYYRDNHRLNNIIKTINPDGFLLKSDVNFKELLLSIETVLKDPPYYSKDILRLMRKQMAYSVYLDSLDRQLLFEISNGVKTKNLPNVISLSIAGVEKRKRKLKEKLNVEDMDDDAMIRKAREMGFI